MLTRSVVSSCCTVAYWDLKGYRGGTKTTLERSEEIEPRFETTSAWIWQRLFMCNVLPATGILQCFPSFLSFILLLSSLPHFLPSFPFFFLSPLTPLPSLYHLVLFPLSFPASVPLFLSSALLSFPSLFLPILALPFLFPSIPPSFSPFLLSFYPMHWKD